MESSLKPLYDRLPTFLQNLAITAVSARLEHERYGGDFKDKKAFLERSQWYDKSELELYQVERLKVIVDHAYRTVPYYRKIMDDHGIKVGSIQSLSDIKMFPLLTRADIIKNFTQLLSSNYDLQSVAKGHTSGTTGSPLEICYDQGMIHMNYALLDRQYTWAGTNLCRFGDRVAVIRGNVVVPLKQKSPPFWRYNYLHKQLLLSSFHLSPATIDYYIGELRKFKPRVLDGYPSTVYVLAKHLKNNGQKLPLHAVLTSSETLYDFQRTTIEESFSCKVFDYFGAAERVVFATECDHHKGHHLSQEYGLIEIIDDTGNQVEAGQMGKMIATSLHNMAMPLIRYVTNDMTSFKSTQCACGRLLPLIDDVATKAEDLLTLRDGRLISPSVLTHPFKPLTSISESQIIQEDLDSVLIKIVPTDDFNDVDKNNLIHGLQERLGCDVSIKVECVERLERSRSGKFKWVISKVGLGI